MARCYWTYPATVAHAANASPVAQPITAGIAALTPRAAFSTPVASPSEAALSASTAFALAQGLEEGGAGSLDRLAIAILLVKLLLLRCARERE